ncbi:hypothetical protein BGZ94_005702 [Podila epigama]|nr:hypothetical protein BGZ94_005702 [Podila epigama]
MAPSSSPENLSTTVAHSRKSNSGIQHLEDIDNNLSDTDTLHKAAFSSRRLVTNLSKSNRPDLTSIPSREYKPGEKFLLMDYSPWLGFNNMRYMLERGLFLADMLNRTLVLPTHLRIRHCSDEAVCAETATPLDLTSIGRNPQGSTIALDLGYFIDLAHLAQQTNGRVIDFARFMQDVIQVPEGTALVDSQFGEQVAFWQKAMRQDGDGEGVDSGSGMQKRFIAKDEDDEDDDEEEVEDTEKDESGSHKSPERHSAVYRDTHISNNGGSPYQGDQAVLSMARVHRDSWDLEMDPEKSFIDNLIRNVLVDDLTPTDPTQHEPAEDGSFVARHTFYAFGDVRGGGLDRILDWSVDFVYHPEDLTVSKARFRGTPRLDSQSCFPPVEDPMMSQLPWEARFPAFATCLIQNYVGLKQELGSLDSTIVSVEGQFHTAGWMPLVYSEKKSALRYRSMAVNHLRYTPAVEEAAEYLLQKLRNKMDPSQPSTTHGLLDGQGAEPWFPLSMHIRRGDFVTDKYGWQKFDQEWMMSLVKSAVESSSTAATTEPGSQDSDDAKDKMENPGTLFYLATDESNSETLDALQALGAVLFEDLIDDTFEVRFGHLVVYDDWIGLVEQLICTRAQRFLGTMTSSLTSGIINLRVERYGLDKSDDSGYLLQVGGPLLPT